VSNIQYLGPRPKKDSTITHYPIVDMFFHHQVNWKHSAFPQNTTKTVQQQNVQHCFSQVFI